jgi:hypothetical protein
MSFKSNAKFIDIPSIVLIIRAFALPAAIALAS